MAIGHHIRVPLDVRAEPADQPPGSDLVEAMVAELEQFYGRIDRAGTPAARPQDMAPPGGRFLVIYEDGEPIACGGVKRLGDGVAEIKRMYVVPEARGRGVARALLVALEDAARDLGYPRVRLDTGREQPHARALYESTGYREIADYNGNPAASYWAEKDL
jgi:GNAT superfamily N-acetyltransferase